MEVVIKDDVTGGRMSKPVSLKSRDVLTDGSHLFDDLVMKIAVKVSVEGEHSRSKARKCTCMSVNIKHALSCTGSVSALLDSPEVLNDDNVIHLTEP